MEAFVGTLKSAGTFIAVLSVLVLVHEWGHFIVAKLCGMRVEEFSLFFWKRLVRLGVRNGTEYNIRALPLGGFVKIAGMEPDDISNGAPIFRKRGNDHSYAANTSHIYLRGLSEEALAEIDFNRVSERVQQIVEQAVDKQGALKNESKAELRTLLAGTSINADEHRYIEAILAADSYEPDPDGYNQRPIWQRAAVIFAGPFMSLLFGYALFCVLGFTTGLPDSDRILPVVEAVIAGKPADKAGIKAGDRVLQIDATPIPDTDGKQMVNIINSSINKPLHLKIQRGNQTLAITVTPGAEEEQDTVNGKTVTRQVGRIGFQPKPEMILKRYTPAESVHKGTVFITGYISATLKTLFSKHVRENIGGPVAIASEIHQARKEGAVAVLLIAAMLSISLGVINLFPIPILDGGHLLLLGIELVRRQKLSTREVYVAQLFGMSIIGALFVFVMFNDIMRLFHVSK
jgi:regulator of sigma E protease